MSTLRSKCANYPDWAVNEINTLRSKLSRLNTVSTQSPRTIRFGDLPKGARFKYPDSESTWVVIEEYGVGLIAKWEGLDVDRARQSMCCFVDGEDWTLDSMVEVVLK